MTDPIKSVLAKLPDVKPCGGGWLASCPAHDDNNPSLSITKGADGRVLLNCHAGCSTEKVVAALGMRMADLMPSYRPRKKCRRENCTPKRSDVPSKRTGPVRADEETCHAVYSAFLEMLGLSAAHRDNLRQRGLTDEEIDACQYRTWGGDTLVVLQLREKFEQILESVPGFGPGLKFNGQAGLLIPVRDINGRIIAIKIRRNGGGGAKYIYASSAPKGPSPGSPTHVPVGVPEASDLVRITEGELKADIAWCRSGIPTISFAGVTQWQDVLPLLSALKAKRVRIAFDADAFSKPQVARQLHACLRELRSAAFEVEVERWPIEDGKGIDDLLAAGKEPEVITGDDVHRVEKELALLAVSTQREETEEPPKEVEYVPFPTDLLPSPAREFVEAGARALGCDPAFIALPLMAALASAVGNTRRIRIKRTWCEPCVFWMVIIGESGTLKSPALELALEFIRQRQATEYREYLEAERQYDQSMQHYEADLAAWKKKGANDRQPPPEKPEPPIWRQRLAEDVTVEAIAVLLQDQKRGILLARDELAGWINSFDAYKSARGADVAHWLSMHSARPVLVNRKTGKKLISARRAAVSVCGGVQPVTLAAALAGRYSPSGLEQMEKPLSEHFANGFAARLLFASPPRLPKRWTEDDLDDAVRGAMQQLFDDLFALEAPVDENGDLVPVDLPMTPEAKRLWVSFFNEHAEEQTRLKGDLAAAWSKGEGYALRLALLFELIANPQSEAVSVASMEAGIELARWFVDEAARVYADLGGVCDDPDARETRELERLVAWIRSHGGRVTARDLKRGPRKFRNDPGAAEAALQQLVEAGYGRWESRQPADAGGRPTRDFVLITAGDGDGTAKMPVKTEVVSPSPVSPHNKIADRVQKTI